MNDATIRGLSAAEVKRLRSDGFSNEIKKNTSRSVLSIVKENIFTLFNLILLILALLVIIFGEKRDALFGGVIIINAVIGIFTELRAKIALDRLSLLAASKIGVIRDSKLVNIDYSEIVRGDFLNLKLGDQAPVDVEIFQTEGIEVDESMLTGESIPISKQNGDCIISGCNIISGSAIVIARKVGAESYVHSVTSLAKKFKPSKSELNAGINQILKWVSFIIFPMILLLGWSQTKANGGLLAVWGTDEFGRVISGVTAGIVGMIPEGLVLLTSLNFAIAAMILAKQNVLIQELAAVETLARVDTILLDKTGTITDGNSRVEQVITISQNNFAFAALNELTKESQINATNLAIQDYLSAQEIPQSEKFEILESTPFSSSRKFSAIKTQQGEFILGAPEFILDSKNQLFKQIVIHQNEGKRVLILANDANTPLLMLVLTETIRADADQTLRYFRQQGVDIKIISGDNFQTVLNIAQQVNLQGEAELHGINATNMPSDEAGLQETLLKNSVFGRVTPEQKLAIVKALQRSGKTVAMTGDGINDIQAMRSADLSIAMGNGAPATKAIAKVILLDSNFKHLPQILGQGRRVMANMERVASLFLTKTTFSILLAIAVSIFASKYPLLPRQISFIGAVTIGIPAFILSLPPNNTKYVPGFLKRVLKFAIPAGIVTFFVILISQFIDTAYLSNDLSNSGLAVIASLVMGMIVLAIKSRPLRSWRGGLIIALVLICVAGFLIPQISWFFGLIFWGFSILN